MIGFFFLVQTSYEDKQDIQLMRFADYFARAFSSVGASQFPWTKILKESSVAKISDVSFLSFLLSPLVKAFNETVFQIPVSNYGSVLIPWF